MLNREIILRNVAHNVREAREKKGLSANQAAKMIDVEHTTITRIENEETAPTIVTLALLAEALGVSIDALTATPATGHRRKSLQKVAS